MLVSRRSGQFIFKRLVMKNRILYTLVILSIGLICAATQAGNRKVLLISDIDDTIKVSHVLDKVDQVKRSVVKVPFAGMAQLYQSIINQNPNSTFMAYVSNAPQKIAGLPVMQVSHKKFLTENSFPKGVLLLREKLSDKSHKINAIRQLIQSEHPELVILIGDNGENDTSIYAQMTTELKMRGIESVTYIHQLYSSKSSKEVGKKILFAQTGFVTPFEIALDLKNKELLDQNSLNWMTDHIMPYLLNEKTNDLERGRAVTFPFYKNCSDFVWSVRVPTELAKLTEIINKKCR